jgi:hypothetical protein
LQFSNHNFTETYLRFDIIVLGHIIIYYSNQNSKSELKYEVKIGVKSQIQNFMQKIIIPKPYIKKKASDKKTTLFAALEQEKSLFILIPIMTKCVML